MSNEWKYDDFVIEYDTKQPIGMTGKQISYSDIIRKIWSDVRPEVLKDLQAWLDAGWEPLTPIDSDCMIVETKDGGFFGGTKVFFKEVRIKMRQRQNK